MNSLGFSSKCLSNDSLPSTSSFVFSESEQTEDEEGERGKRRYPSAGESKGVDFSGNYLDFPPYSDRPHTRTKGDRSNHSPDHRVPPDSVSSPGAATLGSSSATPGDLAFAQKCADLHRFTRPLLELLHGLKTGRFDKGLTGLQQSVAIDRLHRILGVLNKPDMGEKYLKNLLKIEMMLNIWFPQLAYQSIDAPNQTITSHLTPHWRQNQLHMPVKKRKLSWSDSDHDGKVLTENKRHQHNKHPSCQALTKLDAASTCLPASSKRWKMPDEETVESAGRCCLAGHGFTGNCGTLNKPSRLCCKRENEDKQRPEITQPYCHSPATQDNSVSSSGTITANDSP